MVNIEKSKSTLLMVAGVIVLIAVLGMIVFNVDKINLSGEAVKNAESAILPASIGIYNGVDDTYILSNSIAAPAQDMIISFGQGYKRLFGDWDGDRVKTIGYYIPSDTLNEGTFYLSNSNEFPKIEITFKITNIGNPSFNQDDIPIAGDWDGDGKDEVGLYRPIYSTFRLVNNTDVTSGNGVVDTVVTHGISGDIPIIGDYKGDGIDVVGTYRPIISKFFIKQANDNSPIDYSKGAASFSFGSAARADYGIVGDWDGDGKDEVGVYRRKDINNNIVSRFILAYGDIAGKTSAPSVSKQFDFGIANLNNKAAGGVWINLCDRDDDGYDSVGCGGDDCNDNDANVYAGAREWCGDFVDNNCDAVVDNDCQICGSVVANCNGGAPSRTFVEGGQCNWAHMASETCGYNKKQCFAVNIPLDGSVLGGTGCDSQLGFISSGNFILNEYGVIDLNDNVLDSDIKRECFMIGDGYFKIDRSICPNIISPVYVTLYHSGNFEIILKDNTGVVSSCQGGSICSTILSLEGRTQIKINSLENMGGLEGAAKNILSAGEAASSLLSASSSCNGPICATMCTPGDAVKKIRAYITKFDRVTPSDPSSECKEIMCDWVDCPEGVYCCSSDGTSCGGSRGAAKSDNSCKECFDTEKDCNGDGSKCCKQEEECPDAVHDDCWTPVPCGLNGETCDRYESCCGDMNGGSCKPTYCPVPGDSRACHWGWGEYGMCCYRAERNIIINYNGQVKCCNGVKLGVRDPPGYCPANYLDVCNNWDCCNDCKTRTS